MKVINVTSDEVEMIIDSLISQRADFSSIHKKRVFKELLLKMTN